MIERNEDQDIKDLVSDYTDAAPMAPDANELLTRRAEGLATGNGTEPRRLLVPALLGAVAVLLIVGAGVMFASGRDRPTTLEALPGSVIPGTTAVSPTSDPGQSTDEPANAPESDTTVTTIEANQPVEDDPGIVYDATPLGDPTGTDVLPDTAPDSFWAITAETYELVEVDSRTGDILGRYGGWGPDFGDCEGGEGCQFQGLQEVELAADGSLWLTDCCEPAAGNIFTVIPGESFSVDASFVTLGDDAILSPDGSTIAYSALGELMLADRDGENRVSLLGTQAESSQSIWHRPLEWIDDDTLLVRLSGDLVDNLGVFDVSNPSNPRQIGESMGGLISHTDAAVRADGMIFALTRSYRGPDVGQDSNLSAWVFDPETGRAIADTDLPDDIWAIDYDSTGTFLITTGEDETVRFFGAGRSGVLAEGFIAVSW